MLTLPKIKRYKIYIILCVCSEPPQHVSLYTFTDHSINSIDTIFLWPNEICFTICM